ncbi:unnamed protein product [Allacma fusca]|uniref:Putative sodium-coupled neutral amino acid transporter 11 n=1 Tax=Allacma fusca TaxID=39272 RepID=A0A8J2KQC2_9HEXA|nr:unnamed protein product [Allacma fusca]
MDWLNRKRHLLIRKLVRKFGAMDMDDSHRKSTLPQASFNYINSIIGSGVIGMPYALRQSGVGVGIILLIVVAIITDYSLVLMVKAGHLSGSYSYPGMMEAAFGRWGFYILSILQFVYPVIAMISYNVIVGDTLTKVLIYFTAVRSETLEIQREAVVLMATFFVTLPLSLYRNVARMAKISFMSLISIGFIMMSILIRLGPAPINVPATPDAWTFASTGILQAIGVFAFAFMCHHNTFMIYTSMENTNERKWSKVTHISIGTSLAVSLVFSLGGYATFTGNVQETLWIWIST